MPAVLNDAQMKSPRSPEVTRAAVLKAAFDEIHRCGFQAASLQRIIEKTGVTKGALYHHFTSKQALGYAVVDEIIRPEVEKRWIQPLQEDGIDPISVLQTILNRAGECMTEEDILLGCPLNNLAQEMSPLDEGFRVRLNQLFEEWRCAITNAFSEGQLHGHVRRDIDTRNTASFIVGALEGCVGLAKNARSRASLMQCGQGLVNYLDALRA